VRSKFHEIQSLEIINNRAIFDSNLNQPGCYDVSVSFSMRLLDNGSKQVMGKVGVSYTDVTELSRKQQNLLRALERVLYVICNGKPASDRQYNAWHEECLLAFAPTTPGILANAVPIRSGDMTKQQASSYCDALVGEIVCGDQRGIADFFDPKEIETLFKAFHVMYFDSLNFTDIDSWNEYKRRIPFCEFSFFTSSMLDPLERMHIISAGANGVIYEEPWNWIHARHSIHMEQHQYGWNYIIKRYPHMEPRIKFAKEMERRKMIKEQDHAD